MGEKLTHFDAEGQAHMVEIAAKPETPRHAVATASVEMAAATLARIRQGSAQKGDVLGVARIAAIAATKTTAQAIPLCHPVRITAVDVAFTLHDEPPRVDVRVQVQAHDRTGPEMEAMHAASIAALTIYDMVKAIDRGIVVRQVMLLEKSGGKSGHWTR